MNYSLALELKEAGVEQGVGVLQVVDASQAYHPTLEELISACGEKFHCLVHTKNEEKDFWSAGIDKFAFNWKNGSSPEEAVGRLWISLNKK